MVLIEIYCAAQQYGPANPVRPPVGCEKGTHKSAWCRRAAGRTVKLGYIYAAVTDNAQQHAIWLDFFSFQTW